MRTFVALMRGINVGLTRKLPMTALREVCLDLGLRHAETYIQSGNLIVDANGRADDVRDLLESKLTARFGFLVEVVVRDTTTWGQYVATNPFAGDADALPKMVHLYLSRDRVAPDAAKALQQRARTRERVVMAGGALWIDYGADGVHGSKLSPPLIDKACGSPTTGRNWNSVLKIRALVDARRRTGLTATP
ncbi:MAG TPA: DUF1697 domain-containing protein [Acetobacteraceae bacterium]|jgi:uncharacterized protein (DUF1697 family)|nr:DUF1697 domain-containing protein [Acetobacteraceae bacterium]